MTSQWRRTSAAVLLLLGAVCTTACGQKAADTKQPEMSAYDQMLRLLYKQTVPVVQPAALAATLRQQPAGVLLLDTRTPAEYRVSHLQGARLVDFDTFQPADFQSLPRTQPVVVYCSVGARSEQIGARLRALGFQNVHNLYGGIFQWVNDGLPVVNSQGPTTNVHPYSALWRPWLRRGTAAYE